jgi:hypothetical protein
MAYHAIDTGQGDPQIQQDCLKFGPVAVDKLTNNLTTHHCEFDFVNSFIMEA